MGAILTFLRYQPWCNPALFKRYFLKTRRRAEGRKRGGKRALLKRLRGAVFKYTLDGISVRRNKRERFEGEQIVDVKKLDLRRIEYTLNGTEPYMRYNGRFRTERQLQEEIEDLWIRRRNTEQDADDEDYLDDVYGQLSPRLSDITFARLCCISQLCPTADYSTRGFKKEIRLDIDMDYDDDQSDIRLVKNNNSAFIEARERLRKAAQDNWAKSSKFREAVRLSVVISNRMLILSLIQSPTRSWFIANSSQDLTYWR